MLLKMCFSHCLVHGYLQNWFVGYGDTLFLDMSYICICSACEVRIKEAMTEDYASEYW